jgi:hypothetical protein
MLLNSQPSMAFTMSIFRRLHEYSGSTSSSRSFMAVQGRGRCSQGQDYPNHRFRGDCYEFARDRYIKRLMSSYLDYYHPWRTHQSLNGAAPHGHPLRAAEPCDVVEFPAVHGLHHVYLPKAA